MGGGGGSGVYLRIDENLADVESPSASVKNLELYDDRNNTMLGDIAGETLKAGTSTGISNTLVGWNAGTAINSGSGNTGVGNPALGSLTTGSNNVALGHEALADVSVNNDNTAVGAYANIS